MDEPTVYSDPAYGNKFTFKSRKWHVLYSHRHPNYKLDQGWIPADKSDYPAIERAVKSGKLTKVNQD